MRKFIGTDQNGNYRGIFQVQTVGVDAGHYFARPAPHQWFLEGSISPNDIQIAFKAMSGKDMPTFTVCGGDSKTFRGVGMRFILTKLPAPWVGIQVRQDVLEYMIEHTPKFTNEVWKYAELDTGKDCLDNQEGLPL